MLAIRVDDSTFQAGLKDVSKAGRNLSSVFRRLKTPMRRDQRDHAVQEDGPEGGWPPRKGEKPAKRRAGKRKNRRARAILGRLPNAIEIRSIGQTVFARSKVKWARAHADGETVGRGAKLPARSFLWVSDELGALANQMIAEHLGKAWGGGSLPRATVIKGA